MDSSIRLWGTFSTSWLGANLFLTIDRVNRVYIHKPYDQTGKPRPGGSPVDGGAIEQ